MNTTQLVLHLFAVGLFLLAHFICRSYPCRRWKKQPTWTPTNGYLLAVIVAAFLSVGTNAIDFAVTFISTVPFRWGILVCDAGIVLWSAFIGVAFLWEITQPPATDEA